MGYKKILKRLISSGTTTTIMNSLTDKKPPTDNQQANPVWDREAFSALAQLQQFLPAADPERRLIEEMGLTLQAHTLARRMYTYDRLQRKMAASRDASRKSPRQDQSRLSAAIDPRELKQHLFQKIEEGQLYLYEDLTLADLAHELEIEPYQLTRFLNHHLRTSFHDLINAYRVDAAKERLKSAPGQTVLDIAFAVGFNSKASFNRVFKKATGTTPSRYRERELSLIHPERAALKQDTR